MQPNGHLTREEVYRMVSQPAPRKRWITAIWDRLISSGVISSSTPVSRLFDVLPRPTRIYVVGLDVAGKTTLLTRHFSQDSGNDIETHTPFIGCPIEELRYNHVVIHSIDVGGGRKSTSFWLEGALFELSDAVVFVFDAADRDRFVEATEELMIGLNGYKGGKGVRKGVPVLILANKQGREVCDRCLDPHGANLRMLTIS
jgi:hypothetical protein